MGSLNDPQYHHSIKLNYTQNYITTQAVLNPYRINYTVPQIPV